MLSVHTAAMTGDPMSRTTPRLIAVILAVGLSAGLAGCAEKAAVSTGESPAVASPVGAIDPAQQEGCFATEQTVETQLVAYRAQNPDATAPGSLADMVAQGILRAVPACPAGGSYAYDLAKGTLTCSAHGHY